MKESVKTAIDAWPPPVAASLRRLRRLILETAAATPGVGAIEEDLRWGQPSFLTTETGAGSTIRIDGLRKEEGRYALFFHCQSGLVEEFRGLYGNRLAFSGNRAIELKVGEPLPEAELRHCIALALSYHLRKRAKRIGRS